MSGAVMPVSPIQRPITSLLPAAVAASGTPHLALPTSSLPSTGRPITPTITHSFAISSPIHHEDAPPKLSFFGALKKKLNGKKAKAQQEMAQKLKDNPKEDDRVFDEAYRSFLEMETAMVKLNDHIEKQLHIMQESMLYQQLISQDLTFFYCSKGSPFARSVNMTLQPIKTHLAALPDIKELVEVRLKQKVKLEVYRAKVGGLRKSIGLSETGPLVSPTNNNSQLSAAALSKLSKKQMKLDGLSHDYEQLNSKLLSQIVRYVNSKDLILNTAVKHYFLIMEEYASKNLLLHSSDIKGFMKNLETNVTNNHPSKSDEFASPNGPHRKSASATGGASNQSTAASLHSKTQSSLLPLSVNNELDEASSNPMFFTPTRHDHDPSALLGGFKQLRAEALARDQRKHARRQSLLLTKSNSLPETSSSHQVAYVGVPPQNSTLKRQDRLNLRPSIESALAAEAAEEKESATKKDHGKASAKQPHSHAASSAPHHRSHYSVVLYNNPPFIAATPFAERHAMFSPSSEPLPLPATIQTTHQALKQLNQPTRASITSGTTPLPLVQLFNDATNSIGGRTTSLDTKSHLFSQTKSTVPIVNTSVFLQQHRSGKVKTTPVSSATLPKGGLGATYASSTVSATERRSSTTAIPSPIELGDRTTSPTLPLSPPISNSNSSAPFGDDALSPLNQHSPSEITSSSPELSPLSPTTSSASEMVSPPPPPALELSADTDDEFIPPPPDPIDWDEYTSSESDDDDDEDFVTPRGSISRNFTDWRGTEDTSRPSTRSTSDHDHKTPHIESTVTSSPPVVTAAHVPSMVTITSVAPTSSSPPVSSPPVTHSSSPVTDSHSSSALSTTLASDANLRGRPILTGKFAALTEKFGGAVASSKTTASAVSHPTSSSSTAAAVSNSIASASATTTPLRPPISATPPVAVISAKSVTDSSSAATPLAFESSPQTSPILKPQPEKAQVAAPLKLSEEDISSTFSDLQGDLEAVLRMAVNKGNLSTESTTAPNLNPSPAAGATGTASVVKKSPFMMSSHTPSPFTTTGGSAVPDVKKSPFLMSSHNQPTTTTTNQPAKPATILNSTHSPAPVAPPPSSPFANDLVTALYDYTAQRDIELSFKQGDLLVVTSRDASGWWSGHVKGTTEQKIGVFPSNFCRPQ